MSASDAACGAMNRLIVFDCDGTLVDGHASISAALGRCFADAGLPTPDTDASRRIVGLNLDRAMAALLPEQTSDVHHSLAEDYKRAFQQMRRERLVVEPLYDGIADLVDTLEADGWLLAVATGKSDRGLGLCLEAHNLQSRFVSLQTADRHPSKPHPSMVEQAMAEAAAAPETTIVVGDTSYDMAMARSAGATAVGVAWGYHAPEELRRLGADFIADTPADILTFARAFT